MAVRNKYSYEKRLKELTKKKKKEEKKQRRVEKKSQTENQVNSERDQTE